jgi:hypothetical protein
VGELAQLTCSSLGSSAAAPVDHQPAGEHIELREDNTMNKRRLREQLRSRYIAQVRWWGWAMLMLFVLVQVAGADTSH